MPLTRPNPGDGVVAEDFGQPVYDKLIFGEGYAGGTLKNGVALTTDTWVPIENRVTGDVLSWDIAQSDGSLVCKKAGVYLCILSVVLGGFGATAGGTYYGLGVFVNSTAILNLVGGVPKYWDTSVVSGFLTLAVNDKVRVNGGSDIPTQAVDNRSRISIIPVKG